MRVPGLLGEKVCKGVNVFWVLFQASLRVSLPGWHIENQNGAARGR
jgi:hypothetical protein